jgi:uroporphyrinogen decarboxylase
MNSIERIMATVAFDKPDRVAVLPQIFGHAAVSAGVPLTEYLCNGELLAHCQIQALQHYGHDAVFALMDTSVETEAVGSTLLFPAERYPHVDSYILSDASGIDGLRLPNPLTDGRMPELLKAAAILRREVGNDVMVIGCVLGPLTIALQLFGAEKTLYLAIDQPEQFARLLDFATQVSIDFGTAQIEAGVHLPLVFDPFASPDVIPPMFFREIELPHLRKVFNAFKGAGALTNWLHIAGPATPILPYYPDAGVDIANFDYCVNPLEAQKALPHTCLDGNLKPLSLVDATPDAIAEEASRLVQQFDQRGGFILSTGCEIPLEAKAESIAALVSAVH